MTTGVRKLCGVCGRRAAHHRGVLCRACWLDPAIRAATPERRPGGSARGAGHAPPKLAGRPTTAPAGSAAKVEEMRRRVLNGEALFHPDDPRFVRDRGPDPWTPAVVRVVGANAAWLHKVLSEVEDG